MHALESQFMTVEEFNRQRKALQNQVRQAAEALMRLSGAEQVTLPGDVEVTIKARRREIEYAAN